MNIADILIHTHPQLSDEQRAKIEEVIGTQDGVMSVHFSHEHQHELVVAYNPELSTSDDILGLVRKWDQDAVMAGL